MSSIRLSGVPLRAALAIWAAIGFGGGAVALFAVLSLSASHGLLPQQFALGSVSVGRDFMTFIVGICVAGAALWRMYAHASWAPWGGTLD